MSCNQAHAEPWAWHPRLNNQSLRQFQRERLHHGLRCTANCVHFLRLAGDMHVLPRLTVFFPSINDSHWPEAAERLVVIGIDAEVEDRGGVPALGGVADERLAR